MESDDEEECPLKVKRPRVHSDVISYIEVDPRLSCMEALRIFKDHFDKCSFIYRSSDKRRVYFQEREKFTLYVNRGKVDRITTYISLQDFLLAETKNNTEEKLAVSVDPIQEDRHQDPHVNKQNKNRKRVNDSHNAYVVGARVKSPYGEAHIRNLEGTTHAVIQPVTQTVARMIGLHELQLCTPSCASDEYINQVVIGRPALFEGQQVKVEFHDPDERLKDGQNTIIKFEDRTFHAVNHKQLSDR